MKKLLFVSLVVFAIVSLASCKTRCECTVTDKGGSSQSYTYEDMERSECDEQVDVIIQNLTDEHYSLDGIQVECSHL